MARNLISQTIGGMEGDIYSGLEMVIDVAVELRVIYLVLEQLPLTPVRSTVVTMHIANLKRGTAIIRRGTDLLGSAEGWLLHSDIIIESLRASREWLQEHLSSAKDMMLSFRKNSRCKRFFLNGRSPDNDRQLNGAIEAFHRTMDRARNLDIHTENSCICNNCLPSTVNTR